MIEVLINEHLIEKSIEEITIEDLKKLYDDYKIATIKVVDNQVEFIQE